MGCSARRGACSDLARRIAELSAKYPGGAGRQLDPGRSYDRGAGAAVQCIAALSSRRVVVTNLKDDVYLEGTRQLQTLIENLTKQYDKHAQAITPVQQNTGEVYEIVRKRLFD